MHFATKAMPSKKLTVGAVTSYSGFISIAHNTDIHIELVNRCALAYGWHTSGYFLLGRESLLCVLRP